MLIKESIFLGSSPSVHSCPKLSLPEYAFLGRSNVGKSSLINMVCGVRDLAKTSSTPGKTKLINLFSIDQSWILADLPGYGYVQARRLKKTISLMLEDYLKLRDSLRMVFCLVDIRHKPQSLDMQAFEFLHSLSIPFALIFTKSDKLSTAQVKLKCDVYLRFFSQVQKKDIVYFLTSSLKKKGRTELLSYIAKINKC